MIKNLYINNYKGFIEKYFEFRDVNFFVGENSTGKSSIINVIDMICNLRTIKMTNTNWVNLSFSSLVNQKPKSKSALESNSFTDIISVGYVETSKIAKFKRTKDGFTDLEKVVRDIYKYIEIVGDDEGFPIISYSMYYYPEENEVFGVQCNFDTKYISNYKWEIKRKYSFESFINYAKKHKEMKKITKHRINSLPIDLEVNNDLDIINRNTKINPNNDLVIPWGTVTKFFSPIRSLPKNIYTRNRTSQYSSTGEHVPNSLATQFNQIHDSIIQFGKDSGLFNDIKILPIDTGSPSFRVNVIIDGVDISIDQVGTGVSQIMPIISEISSLSSSEDGVFLIQQPELHLHPKAQSALGKYFYKQVSTFESLQLFLETHSDYLIDSIRREVATTHKTPNAIVYYFKPAPETPGIKTFDKIIINSKGRYEGENLSDFRNFYYYESLSNLDL